MKVIIVGGGSTGLLLAQGLKQNSIEAIVYEREDATTYQDRPREWGMTLHWGQDMIKKCVPSDMREGLDEGICCDPFTNMNGLSLPHYNSQTGEKLFETAGNEPRRVSRKKLRNYLSQNINIKYGKKLKNVSLKGEQVVATFEDGTTDAADLLVGCDGAHSVARPFLVGEDAAKLKDIDIQMFNVACSFPRDVALLQRNGHPVFKNSYHPDGVMWWQSIQDVKDPEKPETWLFQNAVSWIGAPRPADLPDQKSRTEHWKKISSQCADPWKSVGASLSDDLKFGVDRTTIWAPVDWSESPLAGRVTLAGDAAHTIPAHRGQGLNNALEDAAKLAEELAAANSGTKKLSQAVMDYETEMRSRALVELPISLKQAMMVHSYDTLMESPMVKMGLGKYKADLAAAGKEPELATQPKEIAT